MARTPMQHRAMPHGMARRTEQRINMQREHTQRKAGIAAAMLVLAASSAFAQDASMAIKGTIKLGACTTSFENSLADFGSVSVADLPDDAYYRLHVLGGLIMDVLCPASRGVSFSVIDEQAGTAIADADMYRALNSAGGVDATNVRGLGAVTINGARVNVGSYIITAGPPLVSSVADEGTGSTRVVLRSLDDGGTWAEVPAFGTSVLPILGTGLYTAGSVAGTPTAGVRHVFPLEIRGALNKGSVLQAAGEIRLEGKASFLVHYE